MMASPPTKRRRRGEHDVESNNVAGAVAVAAVTELTGGDDDSNSSDDDSNLNLKPKAKERELQHKPFTNKQADDSLQQEEEEADIIDLTTSTKTAHEDEDPIFASVAVSLPFAAMTAAASHHDEYPSDEKDEEQAASLALARQLEEQNTTALVGSHEQENRDWHEAERLQKEYDEEQKHLLTVMRQQEDKRMGASVTGRALKFVEKVLALDASIKKNSRKHQYPAEDSAKVSAIAKDDMVFLAEAMIRQQEAFRLAGKPVKVDLGFHYTRHDNLARIRSDGLLSKAERKGRSIKSKSNGSTYGDGIYTADDHSEGFAGRYGDIGIIVARLKGTEKRDSVDFSGDHDCNVDRSRAMAVLKASSQCLALIEFHRSVVLSTHLAATTTRTTTAGAPPVSNRAAFRAPRYAAYVHTPHAATATLHAPPAVSLPAAPLAPLPTGTRTAASTSAAPTAPPPQMGGSAAPAPAPAYFSATTNTATTGTGSGSTAPSVALLPLPRHVPQIARHAGAGATPPDVNSGILGEYHRELQKIVDETFNQKEHDNNNISSSTASSTVKQS